MPYWRTVKINLKLSYQSTILNSLHLIRLRAEFLYFAHRSLYKMAIKVEISIVMQGSKCCLFCCRNAHYHVFADISWQFFHFWIKATTSHDTKKKVQGLRPKLDYRRPRREKWLHHERDYNNFDFKEFLNDILPLRCSMPNYQRSQTRRTAAQDGIDFRWAFRGHHWVKRTKFTWRVFRDFYSCIELENKTINCIMKVTLTVKTFCCCLRITFLANSNCVIMPFL
jgi:hypothetical protein